MLMLSNTLKLTSTGFIKRSTLKNLSSVRSKQYYCTNGDTYLDLTNKYIRGNPVMIFSKSYCPFCHEAKRILNEMNVKHTAIELDEIQHGQDIQDALFKISKQKTVPNIFINGKHIGGCSDLQSKRQTGELHKIMDDSNVVYTEK